MYKIVYKMWSIGLNAPGSHGMGVVAARSRERAMELLSSEVQGFEYKDKLFLEKEYPVHADNEFITMSFYVE